MKKGRNLLLLAAALLCLATFFTGSAEPQSPHVWNVDDDMADFPNADFTSISVAVDEAHPGDTILIHPGTYAEKIVVEKSLKIIADPETSPSQVIIQGIPGSEEIFLVTADSVEISGFTLTGTSCDVGIYLNRVTGNIVSNNIIEGTINGIVLMKANSNTVEDNTVRFTQACGISLSGSDENRLLRNEITGNSQGICLLNSKNNLLGENNIVDNHKGFYQEMCADNTLSNNRIYGNKHNFKIF
ncbi:right-handed parallel beta-helix repeat-containing protein [Methanosarcina horonobensis]|nr:NosD domain-containing protein [Methanosarcina horonobensis]